jgi:hypothetical protein
MKASTSNRHNHRRWVRLERGIISLCFEKTIILIYTIVLFGYGIKDISHGKMTEEPATCQTHNINIGDTNLTPMSYRATQLCDCNKGFQCASLDLGKTWYFCPGSFAHNGILLQLDTIEVSCLMNSYFCITRMVWHIVYQTRQISRTQMEVSPSNSYGLIKMSLRKSQV